MSYSKPTTAEARRIRHARASPAEQLLMKRLHTRFPDHARAVNEAISHALALESEKQRREILTIMTVVDYAPNTIISLGRAFRRLARVHGDESFLKVTTETMKRVANWPGFPVPAAHASGAKNQKPQTQPWTTRTLAQAQRFIRKGLDALWSLAEEAGQNIPDSRPECNQQPGPNVIETTTLPHETNEQGLATEGLTAAQFQALRRRTNIVTAAVDPVGVHSYLMVESDTTYRGSTLRRIRARHIKWNRQGRPVAINPPPGRNTKRAAPMQLHQSKQALAAHLAQRGITPQSDPEALVWVHKETGQQLRKPQSKAIHDAAATALMIAKCTPTMVRNFAITRSMFTSASSRQSFAKHNHVHSGTDSHYLRVNELEPLMQFAARAAGVPFAGARGCCYACGSLDDIDNNDQCSACRKEQHGPTPSLARQRGDILMRIAQELGPVVPPTAFKPQPINVVSNPRGAD